MEMCMGVAEDMGKGLRVLDLAELFFLIMDVIL